MMYKIFDKLSEKPLIGAITGTGSSILYSLKVMFTSDVVLKGLSVFGIWGGAFITLLTIVIKMVDTAERFNKWHKKRKKPVEVE